MVHTTYGLTSAGGRWRATCSCGWRSAPSEHLAEQTDELDQHLRVVVIAEQRPTRPGPVRSGTPRQLVERTPVLAALVVVLLLART